MLRREALVALHAYTKLPESVQGVLEKRDSDFDLAGGLVRSDTFERALKSIDVDSFCVSALRIHRTASEVAGIVQGQFVLRGRAVRLGDEMLAIVTIIVGDIPEGLRSPSNTYLVSLTDRDFVRCASPQQLVYGTNTVFDALGPKWNYVASVFTKRVQDAVVACANGIFCLRAASHPSTLSAEKAELLIRNLLQVDVMIEVDGARPKVIYRLASNCLFVGPEGAQEQVATLQRSLQLPNFLEKRRLLATSVPLFSLDESLLETSGPRVEFEAVKTAASNAEVRYQPLTNWWQAAQSFRFAATVGSDASQSLSVKAKEGSRRDTDVRVDLKFPTFRELRPGETDALLRAQLTTSLQTAVHTAFLDIDRTPDQGALDKLTRTFGELLSSALNNGQLFAAAVNVAVKLSYDTSVGEPVALPNGDLVVVPKYAYDMESPRLNAFLGIFATLGLQGSFTSWGQALRNRVLVL